MTPKDGTRRRILDAGEIEFAEKGYFNASIDRIAERAAVAKGTVYYNFAGKGAVFLAVVDRGLTELTRRVRLEAERDGSVRERLSRVFRAHAEMLFEYPRIAEILFREMTSGLEPAVLDGIRAIRSAYLESLVGLVHDGRHEGVLGPTHPRLAAIAVTELSYAVCAELIATGGTQDEAVEFLVHVFTGGLIGGNDESRS